MAVKNVPGSSRKRSSETNGTASSILVGELVRQRSATFSPAERKLSRALLASYPTAGLESVARLAERAGVSPPTVTRFVGKIGFAGYPEFQDALRREIQERLSSPLARYDADPPPPGASLLQATFDAAGRNLRQTAGVIADEELDAVAALLADLRRSVLVLGGRLSGTLARHLAAQLQLLRPGVELITAGRTTPMEQLVDLRRRDVLVVFDYRRYQPDSIEAAQVAAARRAEVVLFTDAWLSPASGSAGHVLVTAVETGGAFDSLVAALAAVEAVVAAVLARLGERAQRRMRRIDELRARDPGV